MSESRHSCRTMCPARRTLPKRILCHLRARQAQRACPDAEYIRFSNRSYRRRFSNVLLQIRNSFFEWSLLVAAAATRSHPPQYHPSTSVNTPISSPQVNPTTTRSLIHSPPLHEGFVPVPGLQEPSFCSQYYCRERRTKLSVTETLPIDSLLERFLSDLLPKQEHSYVSETRWMSIVSVTIHTHYIFETHITTTFP